MDMSYMTSELGYLGESVQFFYFVVRSSCIPVCFLMTLQPTTTAKKKGKNCSEKSRN